MLTLSTTQQAAVDAKYKKVTWLFRVTDANGTNHHWATKKYSGASAVNWASGIDFNSYNHWTAEEYTPHAFKIVDFRGIQLQRNKNEIGIVAPNDLTFSVVNSGNTYKASDFDDGKVLLTLVINDVPIRRWRFHIRQVEPKYQKLTFVCEDFLQQYLKGYYPNTRLVRDIFASSDVDNNDGVCIPIPFGTAYVPVRSVFVNEAILKSSTVVEAVASSNGSRCKFRITSNGAERFDEFEWGRYVTVSGFSNSVNNGTFLVIFKTDSELELSESAGLLNEGAGNTITITQGVRYYVLGDPDYTYDIDEVRSPRSWGRRSVWTDMSSLTQWATGTSWVSAVQWKTFYTFLQYSKTDDASVDWRVFLAIIADADNNGIVDSPGVWRQGDSFLDMPTKFIRSDTSTMTNPSDVIKEVLRGFGVYETSASAFADAKATFTSWGILWNGALWYKEARSKILARLLAMCNSNLIVDEQIELKPNSRLSQKTITSAEIMKQDEIGEGTFTYNDLRRQFIDDCGYVAWQESGEAQDKFVKTLVPASGSSKTQISREIIDLPWVQDSQDVQALATLYYQRKLMKAAVVGCVAKSSCVALNPGDVVTIDGTNYGGGEVDDETGGTWGPTVHGLSLVDGQAFIKVSGVDLSAYAGTEGADTPYELILHDSAGKVSRGYIGAADAYVDLLWQTGNSWQTDVEWYDPDETLEEELCTNGNCEDWSGGDLTGWAEERCDTAQETSVVHNGTSSCKLTVTPGETNGDIYRSISVSSSKLYRFSCWLKKGDNDQFRIRTDNSYAMIFYEDITAPANWTQYVRYIAAPSQPTVLYPSIYVLGDGLYGYIDDISIQEVTHSGPTGVHILSKENGSTQSWAEIDSGFNYNGTTYTFEVTQRYPVVIDSMLINKDLSIQLACSRYSCPLDDFADLTPSAITIIDDDTSSQWSPVIAGPLTDENMAIDTFKTWDQPYLIVGPTTNAGQYTSIISAINALKDSSHHGIYLKSGTYQLSSAIILPDRDIEIVGEHKDRVIIQNYPAEHAFIANENKNAFKFSSFSYQSRNSDSYSYFLYAYGATQEKNKSKILLQDLNLTLADNEVPWSQGDVGIYANYGSGFITIDGIETRGGKNVIDGYYYDNIRIMNSLFSGQSWYAVELEYCSYIYIESNQIDDWTGQAILATDATVVKILNNTLIAKNDSSNNSQATRAIGVTSPDGYTAIVQGNNIRIVNRRTSDYVTGIYLGSALEAVCCMNTVTIDIANIRTMYGISVGSNSVQCCNNNVNLDNSDATGTHYGIWHSGSQSVIQGNNVNMVNNNAKDIGIYLGVGANNNQGGDNLTYNCGTGISDLGTGNAVTGKDV